MNCGAGAAGASCVAQTGAFITESSLVQRRTQDLVRGVSVEGGFKFENKKGCVCVLCVCVCVVLRDLHLSC